MKQIIEERILNIQIEIIDYRNNSYRNDPRLAKLRKRLEFLEDLLDGMYGN